MFIPTPGAASSGGRRRPAIVPDAYRLLAGWCYLERGLLQHWAGWGRSAGDWEDKAAVCRHTWLQAQIVDRMRRRLAMFPGGQADQPVVEAYAALANAVLLAPTWPDAVRGSAWLNEALARAYRSYQAAGHPVHDHPSYDILRQTLAVKEEMAAWTRGFLHRHPGRLDPAYARRLDQALADLGGLLVPIDPIHPGVAGADQRRAARLCGMETDFRMPKTPGRVRDWDQAPDIMPFLRADWGRSVEARRLFFCIGYMWEMGVAEEQLRWIYHAGFMPWEFVYDEARHMWDESRHGLSGMARLRDLGLDMAQIGYSSYGKSGEGVLEPLAPADLYQQFYRITQIAETGYFETKRYCFEDFRHGADDGSAEMMQFDIIDETSHVEYGRHWMEELARRAGVTHDYRRQGRIDRAAAQAKSDAESVRLRDILDGKARPATGVSAAAAAGGDLYNPASTGAEMTLLDPRAQAHYRELLTILRERQPLKNTATAPSRPHLPM